MVNFLGRHTVLLCQSVGEHGRNGAVKEIEHSVVLATEAGAEFVDTVAEVIRFGPAKLVAERRKPANAKEALLTDLLRKGIEPLQQRYRSVSFTVEDDTGSRRL